VLGDIGTSPLELAGAYAAVANAGKFNTPAPILSIKDGKGKSIPVKRSPGVQAISPQVAMQAVDILRGDTTAPGTSASEFAPWYQQGLSQVAGKTGTSVAVDPHTHTDTTKNASLWFVGMTPDLVATSAIVNFDHPNFAAEGLPGVADAARNAYGAYAAGIWVRALQPSLAAKRWNWTSPSAVSGDHVPNVVGMDAAAAKTLLTSKGFKMVQLGNDPANPLMCASPLPLGKIAYAGPQIAPKGSAITVCPSSAIRQTIYTPPPPPPKPTNTKPKTTPAPPPGRGGGHGGGGRGGGGGGIPVPSPGR
jgi:membrane peptidoglycan carboxypeptidase